MNSDEPQYAEADEPQYAEADMMFTNVNQQRLYESYNDFEV